MDTSRLSLWLYGLGLVIGVSAFSCDDMSAGQGSFRPTERAVNTADSRDDGDGTPRADWGGDGDSDGDGDYDIVDDDAAEIDAREETDEETVLDEAGEIDEDEDVMDNDNEFVSPDEGAVAGDCRDDWKEFPWTRKGENECTKCWTCPGEGFLPGAAFVACKFGDECYRFATTDNCNYVNFPRGSGALPSTRDPDLYCRKDGPNYTYFVCRKDGDKVPFQTVDGTHYYDKEENSGDLVGNVADILPIIGGCPDKQPL